jgi:hypothetical protein
MTRFKFLTATARLSVIIATSALAQVKLSKDILHTLSTIRTGMQVSILRRHGHVTSPVLAVELAEHRAQHQRHARWRETKLQPDRGQRRSATASRMRPMILHQVPSQPLSSFSIRKTRSSIARSKASAGAANAGGAKGPYFWCAFEGDEVRVIGESLTTPDKLPSSSADGTLVSL